MPTAIVLAVIAAVCIGSADFLLGIVGRRDPTGSALMPIYAVVAVMGLALAPTASGDWVGGIWWAILLGALWPTGMVSLMQGIAFGKVIVVIPVAGVLSAAVPVAADLLTGARPTSLVLTGVAIGILALAIIGIGESLGEPGDRSVAWSIAMGAIGGVTTGLSFVVIGELTGRGFLPLAVTGAVAALAMGVILWRLGKWQRPTREALAPVVVIGVVIAASYISLLIGIDKGSLTSVSVIASQYPVVTIVLAAVLWKQRPRGIQYGGVAMSLAAIGMIAAGS